jgi:hypothetical protein
MQPEKDNTDIVWVGDFMGTNSIGINNRKTETSLTITQGRYNLNNGFKDRKLKSYTPRIVTLSC